MQPWVLSGIVALALVLAPELAAACAVCSAGRDDENRFAFLMMTLFMSATPLLLIGGLVYWIRGRFLAQQVQEAQEAREATAETTSAAPGRGEDGLATSGAVPARAITR